MTATWISSGEGYAQSLDRKTTKVGSDRAFQRLANESRTHAKRYAYHWETASLGCSGGRLGDRASVASTCGIPGIGSHTQS